MQLPIYLTSIDWCRNQNHITEHVLQRHASYPYHIHPGDASLPLEDTITQDLDHLYTLFLEHATIIFEICFDLESLLINISKIVLLLIFLSTFPGNLIEL